MAEVSAAIDEQELEKPELMVRAEYARSRGKSQQSLARHVKIGRVELVDGLIDPEAADVALHWSAVAVIPKLAQSQEKKEFWVAKTKELEFRRAASELLESDDVVRGWQEICIAIRAAVLALPDMARLQAGLTQDQADTLRDLVHGILEELSSGGDGSDTGASESKEPGALVDEATAGHDGEPVGGPLLPTAGQVE